MTRDISYYMIYNRSCCISITLVGLVIMGKVLQLISVFRKCIASGDLLIGEVLILTSPRKKWFVLCLLKSVRQLDKSSIKALISICER